MKNLRSLCAATVLTFLLTLSAFAGDMQFPSVTATGDMSAPGATTAGEILLPGATYDPMTEIMLGFLMDAASLL